MLPSQFLALDKYERAFVVAAIEIKMENEKKQQSKQKKPKRKR
jgi:hypothetical protein